MPMQAQLNKMKRLLKFSELDRLCPIEQMLISQIIQLMLTATKTKGAQDRLKGQCVQCQQT